MNQAYVFSRRDFLRTATCCGASVLLGDIDLSTPAQAQTQAAAPAWIDRPMRWAQLTLVEDDPGKFDPRFWLEYFRRTHSDAVCLSAGGCVAYYPTRIPFHHRSAWLKDSDPLGELVAGCRKLGMVVIARTDPHATYANVREAHPDWIAVDAALSSAKRDIDDGGLPGHQGGQAGRFVHIDLGVIAEPALHGAARAVVLHAVAGEGGQLAVIALDDELRRSPVALSPVRRRTWTQIAREREAAAGKAVTRES